MERMTIQNIPWSVSKKECHWTWWGSYPQPPVHQPDVHPTEPPKLVWVMRKGVYREGQGQPARPPGWSDPLLYAVLYIESLDTAKYSILKSITLLTLVILNNLRCHTHFKFSAIRFLDPNCWYKFTNSMSITLDPDQLASSEAKWSGSVWFTNGRAYIIQAQQDQD